MQDRDSCSTFSNSAIECTEMQMVSCYPSSVVSQFSFGLPFELWMNLSDIKGQGRWPIPEGCFKPAPCSSVVSTYRMKFEYVRKVYLCVNFVKHLRRHTMHIFHTSVAPIFSFHTYQVYLRNSEGFSNNITFRYFFKPGHALKHTTKIRSPIPRETS